MTADARKERKGFVFYMGVGTGLIIASGIALVGTNKSPQAIAFACFVAGLLIMLCSKWFGKHLF